MSKCKVQKVDSDLVEAVSKKLEMLESRNMSIDETVAVDVGDFTVVVWSSEYSNVKVFKGERFHNLYKQEVERKDNEVKMPTDGVQPVEDNPDQPLLFPPVPQKEVEVTVNGAPVPVEGVVVEIKQEGVKNDGKV